MVASEAGPHVIAHIQDGHTALLIGTDLQCWAPRITVDARYMICTPAGLDAFTLIERSREQARVGFQVSTARSYHCHADITVTRTPSVPRRWNKRSQKHNICERSIIFC
jgi:hypothetical protein